MLVAGPRHSMQSLLPTKCLTLLAKCQHAILWIKNRDGASVPIVRYSIILLDRVEFYY